MTFHIMTLFPDMVRNGLNTSILARAMEKGLISVDAVNIRDYAGNRHGKVDDYIYGGGAGLLMQAQPVYDCWKAVESSIRSRETGRNTRAADSAAQADTASGEEAGVVDSAEQPDAAAQDTAGTGSSRTRVVYMTPAGSVFSQQMAEDLSHEEDLILLCGHYEGIDERVIDEIVTDPVSIGDFVLTGGELPAMMIVDAVSRLIPGVLGNEASAEEDSFQNGLLEYPQYSRPEEWNGRKVPEILLSGDHAKVDAWRMEQSIERTKRVRPDLYRKWADAQEQVKGTEKRKAD